MLLVPANASAQLVASNISSVQSINRVLIAIRYFMLFYLIRGVEYPKSIIDIKKNVGDETLAPDISIIYVR